MNGESDHEDSTEDSDADSVHKFWDEQYILRLLRTILVINNTHMNNISSS